MTIHSSLSLHLSSLSPSSSSQSQPQEKKNYAPFTSRGPFNPSRLLQKNLFQCLQGLVNIYIHTRYFFHGSVRTQHCYISYTSSSKHGMVLNRLHRKFNMKDHSPICIFQLSFMGVKCIGGLLLN